MIYIHNNIIAIFIIVIIISNITLVSYFGIWQMHSQVLFLITFQRKKTLIC